jgi:hypothetical protein
VDQGITKLFRLVTLKLGHEFHTTCNLQGTATSTAENFSVDVCEAPARCLLSVVKGATKWTTKRVLWTIEGMSAFHRCLVLAAEVAAKTEAAAAAGPTSSAKRRGKNFFEVAALLPNWGVGAKLRRKPWGESAYYEITKIKVKSEVSGFKVTTCMIGGHLRCLHLQCPRPLPSLKGLKPLCADFLASLSRICI